MNVQLNALYVLEIEMSRGEFMLMNHPADEMFRVAKQKLDSAGIRCVSYFSATIRGDRDIAEVIRFAKLLGSSNIRGDATGSVLNRIDQRTFARKLA